LKKPFGCVATDLSTGTDKMKRKTQNYFEIGQEVWLTEGSVFYAIRASSAIPMIFTPVRDPKRSTPTHSEWLLGNITMIYFVI
jgi:predicted acylesterase/phospholipase RssA